VLISLYVEQISAIVSTIVNGVTLFAVLHYRDRHLEVTDADAIAVSPREPPPADPG
jgi:hypothetical protein